jgi:hypothetical protein
MRIYKQKVKVLQLILKVEYASATNNYCWQIGYFNC